MIGLLLNYTPYGSRLGACAFRAVSVHGLACSDRVYTAGVVLRGGAFVVGGWGHGGDGSDGGRGGATAGTKAAEVGWWAGVSVSGVGTRLGCGGWSG